MTTNYASFSLRLLATLIDLVINLLILGAFLFYAASQPTLPAATAVLAFYMLVAINPFTVFSSVLLIRQFGWTPGKFLTGIRVFDEKGHLLSLKRSFFRQTIGYSFSWLFFGLGYLAIRKHQKRQAWHDETVGSYVTVTHDARLQGVTALVCISIFTATLFFLSWNRYSRGPLHQELGSWMTRIAAEKEVQEQQKKQKSLLKLTVTPMPSQAPTGLFPSPTKTPSQKKLELLLQQAVTPMPL